MRYTALTAFVTVSVGISANVLVFSFVNATLLRILPYPEASQLVHVDSQTGGNSSGLSWADVNDLESQPGLFQGVAIYNKRTFALTDWNDTHVDVVLSGNVSPDFFNVLEVPVLLGSAFSVTNHSIDDEKVAVISNEMWHRRYAADSAIIGRSLRLNDISYRIIGVMPQQFTFSIDGEVPDLYIPLERKEFCCAWDARGMDGIGRLDPSVSATVAAAKLRAFSQLQSELHGTQGFLYIFVSLQEYLNKDSRTTLLLLWGAVSALGLVAILNASSIFLAWHLRHIQDLELRVSLGANLYELIREQLLPTALFGIVAAGASLVASWIGLVVLQRMPDLPVVLKSVSEARSLADWRVFLFSVIFSLAATCCASLVPIWIISRAAGTHTQRMHRGLSTSKKDKWAQTLLLTIQLSLTVMLLCTATSFAHSLHSLFTRNPGFRTNGVVIAGIGIPDDRYSSDARMIEFHETAIARLNQVPGVRDVGFGAGVPVHAYHTRFQLDGFIDPSQQRRKINISIVGGDAFQVLGIRLIQGRLFDTTDRLGSTYAAIVNQAFCRVYLLRQDPLALGVRVAFYNGFSMKPWTRFAIVGVVSDSRGQSLEQEPEPEIYISTQQVAIEGGNYFLATNRSPSDLQRELPVAIWSIDPNLERVIPHTLISVLQRDYENQIAAEYVLSSFAIISFVFAVVGLGANISSYVFGRFREVAIRLALGEPRSTILFRYLRRSIVIVFAGSLTGAVLSLTLLRVANSLLSSHQGLDPVALGCVFIAMLLVGLLMTVKPVMSAVNQSVGDLLRAE